MGLSYVCKRVLILHYLYFQEIFKFMVFLNFKSNSPLITIIPKTSRAQWIMLVVKLIDRICPYDILSLKKELYYHLQISNLCSTINCL